MQYSAAILGLLAVTSHVVEGRLTKSTTETVFLPSRETGKAQNIYASVIAENPTQTKYLLACQTDFSPPYTCDGEFTGVTVTYERSAMKVEFSAATYDCGLSALVACTTKSKASPSKTTTLDASEILDWMTPITVLDVDRKIELRQASETTSKCNRQSKRSSSSSGKSSSSKSSSTKKVRGGDSKGSDDDDNCSGSGMVALGWATLVVCFMSLVVLV